MGVMGEMGGIGRKWGGMGETRGRVGEQPAKHTGCGLWRVVAGCG